MLKVLVFESDATFAGELRRGLEAHGCAVTVVDDASAGLQAAASEKPDLILLTIELPRMNGFSVCNKLKRIENLKAVPLIIMSSDATEETFEQHKRLRTRAEDYVHKPIAFADLETRISTFVSLDGGSLGDAGDVLIDEEIDLEESEIEEQEEDEPAPSSINAADDEEVNQFAEMAFDALVHSNATPSGPQSEPPTVQRPVVMSAEAEPSVVRSPVPESQPRGRKADEVQKLQRALEEARSKAGATARDFLELREQLNKKDKEILDLRDQLTSRDKELLALRDANLSQERDKTDLNDKLLELDKQIHELERAVKAAKADKDQAAKRADDHKKKSERLSGELEALGQELAKTRDAHAEENAALSNQLRTATEAHTAQIAEHLAKEAATATEHQQTLESLKAEAEASLAAVTARLTAEKDAALTTLGEQAELSKATALSEREMALGEEHRSHLAAVERANEDTVTQLKAQQQTAVSELSAALGGLRQRYDAAQGKWNEDRAALERMKQALETVLGQLAEVQNRVFESS